MLNSDVNSRFSDWLLNPTEGLDFEVKQWLDMDDPEAHGAIAKALIALENHGGGFLLIGYKQGGNGRLLPDENRPANLDAYNTDAVNAIVKKRAEPGFHVDVTFQKHPESQEEFPLLRVSGTSKVPVRSSSATAGKTLHQNIYYIRRPGPESDGPKTGAEWDHLLRRCLLAQREEVISVLRAFSPSGSAFHAGLSPEEPNDVELLKQFAAKANVAWSWLNNTLADDNPSKIKHGHFAFSAHIRGKSRGASPSQILESIQKARRYTGWSVMLVRHEEATRPKLVDGCLQAWLADPRNADSDFWRVAPDGNFFFLRGLEEDSVGLINGAAVEPGTVFDVTLPVWRLGEFLLRVSEIGGGMFEDGFEVLVDCKWVGLKGRALTILNRRRRHISGRYTSAQDVVHTSGHFSQDALRDMLPEAVKVLTSPLFEVFDFFQPPAALYVEELDEMKGGRY